MRELLVSLSLLTCIPAYAAESSLIQDVTTINKDTYNDYDYYIEQTYYPGYVDDWMSSVTMTRIPRGSLVVSYDGPHKLLLKELNNQFRRLVRKYETESAPNYFRNDWEGLPSNTDWYSRSWMDSLPSDKGGAPDEPYEHVIGKEIDYEFGPLTISNTLKISLDYVAVFKLNTDPTTPDKEPNKYRVAVDIDASQSISRGTEFKFKFKPNIRIGLNSSGSLFDLIKNASIRIEMDIVIWGIKIIQGELELKYKDVDDIRIELSLSLAAW
jgi:hypothetical protein